MAPKLTINASETLNDIVLHHLQEEGLAKAEAIEQSFFDHFKMDFSNNTSSFTLHNGLFAAANGSYLIVYHQLPSKEAIVLTIVHHSRAPNILNHVS
jgi:plasmid stabilization system protein ParE